MKTELTIQKIPVTSRFREIIRDEDDIRRNNFLKSITDNLDWDEFGKIIEENLEKQTREKYNGHDLLTITKCLVLGEILGISDYILPFQISEISIYKDFTGLNTFSDIPKVKILNSFRNCLIENKIYNSILDTFYRQLLKPGINILEYKVGKTQEDSDELTQQGKYQESEYKIREIDEKIKTLYDRKLPLNLIGISEEKADALSTKLVEVNLQIVRLMDGDFNSESPEYQYLLNVEKSIDRIHNLAGGLEGNEAKESEEEIAGFENKEKLHKQLFDTFFETIEGGKTEEIDEQETNNTNQESAKTGNDIDKKLKYADKILDELTESSNNLNLISGYKKKTVRDFNITYPDIEKVEMSGDLELKNHTAISLNPKTKKEGIFNDENLTEDYELGFRFHQLGLKTGFFNIKLDSHNESTRIATAEFFPNKFWTSVKQRSRWIAGICLQNWKAHKWHGNLATRYFLFRDRKPLFSLPGGFLSNILFLYLVYSVSCDLFGFESPLPLVNQSSALWYLMISILVFMFSRAIHRFIFTFNWYGFRFAASSIGRSLLDTFINFFAVLRALKVFRQTKKKVVWDATTHY